MARPKTKPQIRPIENQNDRKKYALIREIILEARRVNELAGGRQIKFIDERHINTDAKEPLAVGYARYLEKIAKQNREENVK